ncbi:MAG: HypC/HybG/HupF family hydrogenase formation chaperone [Gammaproteobacteria bacterium]|nr:HypC/HybG/HupF family hydrogenase formation chaperone [Gammaproteobacteria bacterium]
MCLAIPMQVIETREFSARCEAKGIEREVSLFMLQHETVVTGDFVMVHLGYATQKVSAEDAAQAWALYDQMLAADPR